MSIRLHLFLFRFLPLFFLLLGSGLSMWFWPLWAEGAIFLFFLPGLFVFMLLPWLLAAFVSVRCGECGGSARLQDLPGARGLSERVYRCQHCAALTRTGRLFRKEWI